MKTPQQIQTEFRARGINVSQWCRDRGFHRNVVTDLLRGRLKGHRGEAHRAAIALGLKPDPDEERPQLTTAPSKRRRA